MADIDEKTPLNVPGKFYVDSSCIDCDLCRETAPENFGRDEDEGCLLYTSDAADE